MHRSGNTTAEEALLRAANVMFVAAMPAVIPVGAILLIAASRLPSSALYVAGLAFLPIGIFSTTATWILLRSSYDKHHEREWRRPTIHQSFRRASWTWTASAFVSFAALALLDSSMNFTISALAAAMTVSALVWFGFRYTTRELEKEKDALQRVFPIPFADAVRRLRLALTAEDISRLKETRHPITKRLVLLRLDEGRTMLELRGMSRTVAVIHDTERRSELTKIFDRAFAPPLP